MNDAAAESPPLFHFTPGTTPLLVSVPHAGTFVPPGLRDLYTPQALTVPDTDWHVARLYGFAPARGVGLIAATHSRYVIDLNRNPDGAALYAGADNTELCPTSSFAGEPLYKPGCAPDAAAVARRQADYWQPYHDALAAELGRLKREHGYAILLDGHSILSRVPRFFDGRLPDLNLGTADGRSCAPLVEQAAAAALSAEPGFSFVDNGRFKGGTITRRYGQPLAGVHSLQLEMAQSAYLDEGRPEIWQPERAAALVAVLQRLSDTLLGIDAGALVQKNG